MNITVRIEFANMAHIQYEIREIIYKMKELGESYRLKLVDPYLYRGNIKLDKDSYGYKELIKLFQNDKTEWRIYGCIEKVNLTKKEKEDIEYFLLQPYLGKWYDYFKDAQYFGTKYQSECSCHLKQKPLSPFYAPTKKINNKLDICEMEMGIIVSDKVRNLIEDAQCTGVEFEKDIANFKTKEVDSELNRLIITNTLPQMSEKTENIVEKLCERCGNVHSKIRGKVPIYERKDLERANDFNLARESNLLQRNHSERWDSKKYEKKGVREIEEQYYIVSRKVVEIFKENKIKNFLVSPILYTDMLDKRKPARIFHNRRIQIEEIGEFIFHNEQFLETKTEVELFGKKYNIWFTIQYEGPKRNLTIKNSMEYLLESCGRFGPFLKNKKAEVEKKIFQEYQSRKEMEYKHPNYIEVNTEEELSKIIELKEIIARTDWHNGPYFDLFFKYKGFVGDGLGSMTFHGMFRVTIKENEFYVDTYEKE